MTPHAAKLTNLLLSLALATGLLCAGTNASAQTTANVTIPFGFSADRQDWPAGSYKVQLVSDRFLILSNVQTGQSKFLMVRPEKGNAIETRSRLIFRQEGRRKYLSQVWLTGTSLHSEMDVQQTPEMVVAKGKALGVPTIELALR